MSAGGKTEKPTPQRLEDARKDGQVARSEDTLFVLLFGLLFGYLIFDGQRLAWYLVNLIALPARLVDLPFAEAAAQVARETLSLALLLVFGVLGAAAALSTVLHWIQIGPLFTVKPITPSLKKLNAVQNIKEIFSLKTLVEVCKTVVKSLILAAIATIVLHGDLALLFSLPWRETAGLQYGIGRIMTQFVMLVFFCFAVLALFDFFWQRRQHVKQLMMKKEEVQRERKENEGDPHFKQQRRSLLKEIVLGDSERVPLATAVVTNPTHLAVALYYDPDMAPLPVIIAKGADDGAQAIIAIARRSGVPIIQNIPVARSLYARDVFKAIPTTLISAVAEIIVLAQRMREAGSHAGQSAAMPHGSDDEPPTDPAKPATAPDAAAPRGGKSDL